MKGWQERSARLFGADALDALASARVLVAGLGGVGGSAALALVRAGVGNVLVLDKDVVEPTNLNRQALAYQTTLGAPKVDVFEQMAHDINPACKVERAHMLLRHSEVADFLATNGPFDFVLDALDSISVKLAFAVAAHAQNTPIISVFGTANKLDPTQLCLCDLFQTRRDAIARIMRKEARKLGLTSLTCVTSPEKPAPVKAQLGTARSERTQLGTTSYLPAIAGEMAAGYVVCHLTGHPWQKDA